MLKIQKKLFIISFSLAITLTFTSCSRKGASCPAYTGIDPVWNGINSSKEKFVNADTKPKTPEEHRKDVQKEVKKQLDSKTKRRKKPHNLFPSYMR